MSKIPNQNQMHTNKNKPKQTDFTFSNSIQSVSSNMFENP